MEQVTSPEQTGTAAPSAPAVDPAATPAAPAAPEISTPSNGEGEKQPDQTTQQKGDAQQGYIRRLQAQRARERARAETLAAEKAELESRLKAAQPGGDAPPKQDSFQDYNDYIRAEAQYAARQEAQRALQQAEQARSQAAKQAETRKVEQNWEARTDKAREQYADFDESVDWLKGQVPQDVLPVLAHSEHGPELLYYLSKHPDELERIQALPPVLQAREAWNLEAKVKPAPKQTQAPKPIEPVKSTSATEGGYHPGMSQDEYARYRARRLGRTK